MPGVRAEPKYLRDPTSLETISSGLSRLSSYVASNIPLRKPGLAPYIPTHDPKLFYYQQQLLQQQQHQQQQQQQQWLASAAGAAAGSEEPAASDAETITFASFGTLDTPDGELMVLLLGYDQGFQLWNVSQPENVRELASVRSETLGTVKKLHLLAAAPTEGADDDRRQAPLLAIISTGNNEKGNSPEKTRLSIYSLQTHEFVPMDDAKADNGEVDDDNDEWTLTDVKSNQSVMVVGCQSRSASCLRLYSMDDLSQPFATLSDVFHHADVGPVFTLGSRLIAYATTQPVLNQSMSNNSSSSRDKDMKDTARDLAKEMVHGVKSLGELGYQRFSNYLHGQDPLPPRGVAMPAATTAPASTAIPHATGAAASPNASGDAAKKSGPQGMVMVRDLQKLDNVGQTGLSGSTVAHFKPHTHAVAFLAFNAAGNLLMSISTQGHTFHIFSIFPTERHLGNAAHMYSLTRGYTDAQVVDCQFSLDSTWCAVTTARGTTHMYTINPYGGKPEISGHVNGKINNLLEHPFVTKKPPYLTSLNPAVRVKQRRAMPQDPTLMMDELDPMYAPYYASPPFSGMPPAAGAAPPAAPVAESSDQANASARPMIPPTSPLGVNSSSNNSSSNNKRARARLTTRFLSITQLPQQGNGGGNGGIGSSATIGAATMAAHALSPSPTTSSSSPPPPTYPSTGSSPSSGNNGAHVGHSTSPSSTSGITTTNFHPAMPPAAAAAASASLTSIRQHASTLVSQVSSYLPQAQKDWSWSREKSNNGDRLFGFDEEQSALEDDLTTTKMVNDHTGYQDVYSLHPAGYLTLHRLWITKTLIKKRVQGRLVGKWDLSVKQEDVAEWQVARGPNWDEVKTPLQTIHASFATTLLRAPDEDGAFSPSPSSSSTTDDQPQSLQRQSAPTKAGKKKKHQQHQQHQQQQAQQAAASSPSAALDANSLSTSWLSHAEIMTYAPTEPALWTHSQFSFQVYQGGASSSSTPSSATSASSPFKFNHLQPLVPPSQPVVVRSDTPEPYASRLTRVGMTNAKARSIDADDEYMDDALAELEENLSTAMQTTFSKSPSPRRGMRLSSSAGASSSSHHHMSSLVDPLDERTSSLSFEDAYLISLGGAPAMYARPATTDDVFFMPSSVKSSSASLGTPPSAVIAGSDSPLIQFEENHQQLQESPESRQQQTLGGTTNDMPMPDSTMFSDLGALMQESMGDQVDDDDDDNDHLHQDVAALVFSPDGDNENALPSDSMFLDGHARE